jgi:hypothetical protein
MARIYRRGALVGFEFEDDELDTALAQGELYEHVNEATYVLLRQRGPRQYVAQIIRNGAVIGEVHATSGVELAGDVARQLAVLGYEQPGPE